MSRRNRQSSKRSPEPLARPVVVAEIPPAASLHEPGTLPGKEKLIWAASLLILYALIATWGQFDFSDLMGYYNMQADGFLAGHLYIEQAPSQGFLMDMIPFENHYYLQWGPFPALLHLLPRAIGARLSDRVACILAG